MNAPMGLAQRLFALNRFLTERARDGRNTVLMESADDGPIIYFSDPGAGASKYSIKISFSPK